MTLKAPKPLPEDYPKELKTIGDHIRKKRLDLGLFQKDVAKRVGVTTSTMTNWEKGRTTPRLRHMPRVLEFLGYIPENIHELPLGERIVATRTAMGIRQEDLARGIGVDPSTLARWEQGKREPLLVHMRLIEAFLDTRHVPSTGEETETPFIPQDSSQLPLGERIFAARKARGISQKDLAQQFGVNPTTLSRWEQGRHEPLPIYRHMVEEFLDSIPSKTVGDDIVGD